jgi:thiopeptide-type bacteriocin biosynthesis protein
MSTLHYSFQDQFVFRVPRLPLDTSRLDPVLLKEVSRDPSFIEAIYLASPVLHDELLKWHKGELTSEKEIQKLLFSLGKYYTRMQSRSTPYGLFAGCGTGTWADSSDIILDTNFRRHTRLDMNFLCALAQKLSTHPVLLPFMRFYPNDSIYVLGKKLRYVEYKYHNNRRVHQISSVDHSAHLQAILNQAHHGARISELSSLLVDEEVSAEEAEGFILELISNQILVTELEPAVTGDEFIFQLIDSLQRLQSAHPHPETENIIGILKNAKQLIQAIDEAGVNDTNFYKAVFQALTALNTPMEENQLFQADLHIQTNSCLLDRSIQKEIEKAFRFLNRLNPVQEHTRLRKFTESFNLLYEDAEIPLLEALDTESGAGYTGKDIQGIHHLLDDVHIPAPEQNDSELRWNKLQNILHRKLTEASRTGQYIVHFSDEDLKDLEPATEKLPDTMPVMFRVLNSSGKIQFQNSGGSSAANLLGRFAHGDETIKDIIGKITSHEQDLNPEKILAEIVHLPESRIGNILLRPVLREYEIPCLGKSALPDSHQIRLEDLMVSIRNGKIQLRSKKLNKIIVPRLSTAHNFSFNALPVYQFLCDLQVQDFSKSGLMFDWGLMRNQYPFLPRAEYQNTVLARASWQLTKKDFQPLLAPGAEGNAEAVEVWRKQWNMPPLLIVADGDNELLIDLKKPFSVAILLNTIKNKDTVTLEEFLFEPDDLLIKDNAGNGYTNEFIALLHKTMPLPTDKNISVVADERIESGSAMEETRRHFSIGSEWLYYKLYCGIKTADSFLASTVKPLVEELLEKKLITKFFFIRYQDPDHHLRIRFLLSDLRQIGPVIELAARYFEPHLGQGLLHKIQTDTYSRELERYGPAAMEMGESFFFIDSLAALNLLDMTEGEEGEQIRWLFALRSVDELLDTFHYTPEARLNLLGFLKTSFTQEHSTSKDLKIQLDTKFRNVRNQVENILDRSMDEEREIMPLIELLKWKSEELQPVSEAILDLEQKNRLHLHRDNLISSYIHMMLNRIFMSRQRTYEMVMYDLLYRFYKSKEGRNRRNKNSATFAEAK